MRKVNKWHRDKNKKVHSRASEKQEGEHDDHHDVGGGGWVMEGMEEAAGGRCQYIITRWRASHGARVTRSINNAKVRHHKSLPPLTVFSICQPPVSSSGEKKKKKLHPEKADGANRR